MSTPAASSAALFDNLVDDAAIFPPGNAPMDVAVKAHRELRAGPLDPLVGVFLCAASRLDELRAQLRDGDQLRLGLVVDTGVPGVSAAVSAATAEPRIALQMVEVALQGETELIAEATVAITTLAALPTATRGFVEVPRKPGWRDALGVIAATGPGAELGAKLRTGGATARHFPTAGEVADFIVTCVEATLPFKCTAGLHRAVRHTAADTGFEHHGFLNILLATGAAISGANRDAIEATLAERDPAALTAALRDVDDATATQARVHFVSFGTCSVAEPAADLADLGLLPERR